MSKFFSHLHVHSDFSINDGFSNYKNIIDEAINNNMESIAITDFNLFGVLKFYNYAIQKGIKPIIGLDVYLLDPIFKKKICIITLLAHSNCGFENLKKISSLSYNNYIDCLPVVKYSNLLKYKDGISIISGFDSDISYFISLKKYLVVDKLIRFYNTNFKKNFYFGLCRLHNNFKFFEKNIFSYSSKYNIKIIATNNVKFVFKNDFKYYLIRTAICNDISLSKVKELYFYTKECYLKNFQEMFLLFNDIKFCLLNSYFLSKQCNVKISQGKYFIPSFCNNPILEKKMLIKLSSLGLNKRFLSFKKKKKIIIKKEYYDRLFYEIKIINNMNFVSYFLIVMEFVVWAKKNSILVGPGRGSGASSLVAFCLNITEIDPISFGLLFERFLNPYRISMPDIDIDFCMNKRDLVINHVYNKYGVNRVANIITFGTLTAKSAIRDVARILGYSYIFALRLSKMISIENDVSILKSLELNSELCNLYNSDLDVKYVLNSAMHLEGVIRTIGTHAGGIIISPKNIINFSPTYKDINGKLLLTQFDKSDLENIGLIKFDFLALRTLTIIDNTINFINLYNNVTFVINDILLNDEKSFILLNSLNTIGVFQLESVGMKKLISKLNPSNFNEIIALIALFRPGPLHSGMVDNYIRRKKGEERISYPDKKWQHNILKSILQETYGIILYQEQVIKIVQLIAGYSLVESDILRLIISKKKKDEMLFQKYLFQKRARKQGIDRFLSFKIFDILENFSEYGFNKAHSTAYAMITYQTLWLKANFKVEFMCSVLNSEISNFSKLPYILKECNNINIDVLSPDVNISNYLFFISEKKIIFGLGAIKGLGKIAVDYIVLKRNLKKNKSFDSFYDFCLTVCDVINKNIFEQLILSGACDSLCNDREFMYLNFLSIIESCEKIKNNKRKGQLDIFEQYLYVNNYDNNIDDRLLLIPQKRKYYEKEVMSISFSKSNIFYFKNEIYFFTKNQIINIKKNKCVVLIGIIESFKLILTKKKKYILFISLKDESGSINVLILNNNLIRCYNYLFNDMIICVKGYISDWNNESNFVCDKIGDFLFLLNKKVTSIFLNINFLIYSDLLINKILLIIQYHCRGSVSIYINVMFLKHFLNIKINKYLNVLLTYSLILDLKFLLGNDNVILNL